MSSDYAIARAIAMTFVKGRDAEREEIVAWLRAQESDMDADWDIEGATACRIAAGMIERCDHHKTGGQNGTSK